MRHWNLNYGLDYHRCSGARLPRSRNENKSQPSSYWCDRSRIRIVEEFLHLLPALKTSQLAMIRFDISQQTVNEMGSQKEITMDCC
jgi:hypothetical protein